MKSLISNTILSLLVVLALASCARSSDTPTATPLAAAATIQPDDSQRMLTVHGLERTYLLHVPPGLDVNQSAPLVFVFHGYQMNANLIQVVTGFNNIADENGFIVVYPNGTGYSSSDLSWNGGGCCGYANDNNVDETALVRQIISDVGTITKIDSKRVYATGFSNGALLSYRLACEMSDTFAAVAPVAGVLLYGPCQPQQPVSVIHMHGLNDNLVPYTGGGTNPVSGQAFPPVEQSIAVWVQLDGCSGSPQVEQNGIVTQSLYASCQEGMAVELYTFAGIGHSWPPYLSYPPSQIIWDFFAAHPKP